jgi:hypothetical protein
VAAAEEAATTTGTSQTGGGIVDRARHLFCPAQDFDLLDNPHFESERSLSCELLPARLCGSQQLPAKPVA